MISCTYAGSGKRVQIKWWTAAFLVSAVIFDWFLWHFLRSVLLTQCPNPLNCSTINAIFNGIDARHAIKFIIYHIVPDSLFLVHDSVVCKWKKIRYSKPIKCNYIWIKLNFICGINKSTDHLHWIDRQNPQSDIYRCRKVKPFNRSFARNLKPQNAQQNCFTKNEMNH